MDQKSFENGGWKREQQASCISSKGKRWKLQDWLDIQVHISGWVLFNWLCLQVKSVLDPCEDENEDIQDDEVSLGADSAQKDDYSESDSEVNWQHYSTFTFSLPF